MPRGERGRMRGDHRPGLPRSTTEWPRPPPPPNPGGRALPRAGRGRILRPVPATADAVYAALARQLQLPADELQRRHAEPLDRLGLDSHGLMRVLLDIERALSLPSSLELGDEALATPATLVAGVSAAVGR